MNKVFRFVGIGFMAVIFMAAGAANSYAQAECDNTTLNLELDTKIRENYGKNETLATAIDAGKQYLDKFGSCDTYKDFVTWLRGEMPKWEERKGVYDEWVWRKPRIDRFDPSVKSLKYEDAFAAGGEIIARYEAMDPNSKNYYNPINQQVALALAGLSESFKQNYKFNNDAMKYARTALAKLKAGAPATKKNDKGQEIFGVFQFDRTREDAISELTYAVGFINYWDKKDKKAALASFYEVTQLPGVFKNEPRVYAAIGDYFREEAERLGKETAELVKQQQAATTEEAKLELEKKIKAQDALLNGYTERSMDAYSRAYSLASDKTPDDKKYKDTLFQVISFLYERRFEKKDGINSWISSAIAKPMPNPTSDVQPITDPEPTTGTTTTGSTAVNRP